MFSPAGPPPITTTSKWSIPPSRSTSSVAAERRRYARVHRLTTRDDNVVMTTLLGTDIGSALFVEGELVPNTELGHIQIDGKDAERHAAESVREAKNLSWRAWAKRLDEYFDTLEALFSPDLFVVGGGVSKKSDRFLPYLSTAVPVIPAELLNDAGIVGAALAAARAAADPVSLET